MGKGHLKPSWFLAACDRCGAYYKQIHMRTEWTGLFVCRCCWDPWPPQLDPPVPLGPEGMPPIPFRPNELSADGSNGCFIDNNGILWIFSDLTILLDGTSPFDNGSFVDNNGMLWIFSDLTYLIDGATNIN